MKKKVKKSNTKEAFQVGEKLFIRTVTYFLTGRVKSIKGNFLELEEAAWIADTGRFMGAIESGNFSEIEPVTCNVRVNIDTIVDVYEWRFDLPRVQK